LGVLCDVMNGMLADGQPYGQPGVVVQIWQPDRNNSPPLAAGWAPGIAGSL
jgi:hypothetical protein